MEPTPEKAPGAPVVPVDPAAKPRRRIRNFLLEPRFQVRYAGLLAGVALAVFTVLGVVIVQSGRVAAEVSNAAVDLAGVAADQAERALQESQASAGLLRLQRLSDSGGDPAVTRAMESELDAVEAQGRTFLRAVHQQREQAHQKRVEIDGVRRRVNWIVLATGLALALSLFAVGIVLSHRIVGPSYRLKKLFWKVSQGDLAITEKLRGGDELVDLFDAFTSMVASLRAQHAGDLAGLDAALSQLAKAHPDEEGVKALRAAIERMRQRRGAQDDTAAL
jgi:methyl-accepting chemotaxis protein